MSESVDELADALRQDPVQVDPLFGNGRTEEVHEALTDVVEAQDFAAYVVLVPRPEGLSVNNAERELASLLHQRLGGDAVFYVHLEPSGYTSEVAAFGDAPDPMLIYRVEEEHAPDGGAREELTPAGIAARSIEALGSGGDMSRRDFDAYAQETVWREPPEWDPVHDPPTEGTYAMVATLAFVVAAGCTWLVLRTVLGWRDAAPVAAMASARREDRRTAVRQVDLPELGPAEVRAEVERELDRLADRLRSTGSTRRPAETRELIDGSVDTARAVLERVGTAPRDLDDLVGALVLVRVADRALAAGRRRPDPYRPCFFDPRHGQGRSQRSVPVGDRTLSVPACKRCARSKDADLRPMSLPTAVLGRERPWFEHDTVWARTGYGAFVEDLWHHVAVEQREGR